MEAACVNAAEAQRAEGAYAHRKCEPTDLNCRRYGKNRGFGAGSAGNEDARSGWSGGGAGPRAPRLNGIPAASPPNLGHLQQPEGGG